MNIPSIQPIKARRSFHVAYVFAALLLAALALAILAIDTQPAQADVVVTAFNYISNGSFEKDSNGDGLPNGWIGGGTLTPKDKRVCNQSQAGNCSFKFKADTGDKWIKQCKPYTGTDLGNQFKFKAWTKGKSVVLGSGDVAAFVGFYETGGYINGEYIWLPGSTTPWTQRQVTISAAADYDEVCVFLETWADSGNVWFDKLSLVYLGGP